VMREGNAAMTASCQAAEPSDASPHWWTFARIVGVSCEIWEKPVRYAGLQVDAEKSHRCNTASKQCSVPVRVEEVRFVTDSIPAGVTLLPLTDVEELAWQEQALCAQTDPEAFFPEKGGSTREAKRVCLSCEVRVECLEYALEQDERFGIWGGLSERERRRLKKRAI